jgi:hypothetical protein
MINEAAYVSVKEEPQLDDLYPYMDISLETMELLEIESEYIDLFGQYTRGINKSGFIESICSESVFEDDEKLLDRIIAKLKEFGRKIIEIWDNVTTWIKGKIHGDDSNWWYKYKYSLSNALKNDEYKKIEIKAFKYAEGMTDPANKVIEDMSVINAALVAIYDLSERLMRGFIGSGSGEFIKSLKVDNDASLKEAISDEIENKWTEICSKIGLEIKNLTANDVRTAIMTKYYGGTTPERSEIPLGTVLQDSASAENILDPSKVRDMDHLCTIVKNGSSKCDMLLSRIQSAGDDVPPEGKLGAIHCVRLALSVCNVMGQTYWKIFLNARSDMKTATMACVKAYNDDKGKQNK